MGEIAIKIGWALLGKLLTEQFVAKTIVYVLDDIAGKTTNKVDDQITKAVADALGVSVPQ